MSDLTGDYQHTPMVTLAAYHDHIAELEAEVKGLRVVAKTLGRQLPEAERERDEAQAQLRDAQGQVAAVREWQEDWDGVGTTIDWPSLSAILEVKGCVCGGPSMQPCGPDCKYSYTDQAYPLTLEVKGE